jgi:hypothetical protein
MFPRESWEMPSKAITVQAVCRPAKIGPGWIATLDRRVGWGDLPRSYRLLKAVLHALDAAAGEMPLRRCGRAWEDATSSQTEVAVLLQRVATGFKPDRLDNPEAAVIAVLDVLDGLAGEPGRESIRDALAAVAGPPPLNPATITWSRSRSSVQKEQLR